MAAFVAAILIVTTLLGFMDARLASVFTMLVVLTFICHQDGKFGSVSYFSLVPMVWFFGIYREQAGIFLGLLVVFSALMVVAYKKANDRLHFGLADALCLPAGFSAMLFLGQLPAVIGCMAFGFTMALKMGQKKPIRALPHLLVGLLAAFVARIIILVVMPGLFI